METYRDPDEQMESYRKEQIETAADLMAIVPLMVVLVLALTGWGASTLFSVLRR